MGAVSAWELRIREQDLIREHGKQVKQLALCQSPAQARKSAVQEPPRVLQAGSNQNSRVTSGGPPQRCDRPSRAAHTLSSPGGPTSSGSFTWEYVYLDILDHSPEINQSNEQAQRTRIPRVKSTLRERESRGSRAPSEDENPAGEEHPSVSHFTVKCGI